MVNWFWIKERKQLISLDTHKVPKFSLKSDKLHPVKVTKVVDGDTFKCIFKPYNGSNYFSFSIRMLGYDSPEIRRCTPEEKELGLIAKSRLSKIIQDKIIYLKCDDFDCFGRLLGTAYLDKNGVINVNDLMIKFLIS